MTEIRYREHRFIHDWQWNGSCKCLFHLCRSSLLHRWLMWLLRVISGILHRLYTDLLYVSNPIYFQLCLIQTLWEVVKLFEIQKVRIIQIRIRRVVSWADFAGTWKFCSNWQKLESHSFELDRVVSKSRYISGNSANMNEVHCHCYLLLNAATSLRKDVYLNTTTEAVKGKCRLSSHPMKVTRNVMKSFSRIYDAWRLGYSSQRTKMLHRFMPLL